MANWIDLKNNPRVGEIYQKRLEITRLVREFFWSRGFNETETPIALRLPGQEPHLDPVPVEFHEPNQTSHRLYLQTSPESAMKKLLGAGFNNIFQICKCFRDYESFGGNHNPEFTMIEWYRSPGALSDIMDDTEQLFKYIAEKTGISILDYRGKQVPVNVAWERLSMREVWQKFVGVELNDYLTVEKMQSLVRARGFDFESGEYDDLFYKIFLNEIEPKLGIDKPIMIYDYPEQMTSLSRLSKDARYAERFELYVAGLEIANAFGELTDAEEQNMRLESDRAKRLALGKQTWPVDPDFIAAIKEIGETDLAGKNEALVAGIALGIDRMIMLFTGAKDINEVIFQALGDNV